jgi:hypothetical protein
MPRVVWQISVCIFESYCPSIRNPFRIAHTIANTNFLANTDANCEPTLSGFD